MRSILTLAAVAALSITPANAQEIARLSDFQSVPQQAQREVPPASRPTTHTRVCAYRTLPNTFIPTDGCSGAELRAYLTSLGVGVEPARAPAQAAAPSPIPCTVVEEGNRRTITGCSESLTLRFAKAKAPKQRAASASPLDQEVNARIRLMKSEAAIVVLAGVVGAGTDRLFYGRGGYGNYGYSGRGRGNYNPYGRGYNGGSGLYVPCNRAAGQYCP